MTSKLFIINGGTSWKNVGIVFQFIALVNIADSISEIERIGSIGIQRVFYTNSYGPELEFNYRVRFKCRRNYKIILYVLNIYKLIKTKCYSFFSKITY